MKKFLLSFFVILFITSCNSQSSPTSSVENSVRTTTNASTNTATTDTTKATTAENDAIVARDSVKREVVMADTAKTGLDAPSYGTGKHVLQIWADFQCPACQSTNTTITPVFNEFVESGKMTIEYRQFPLTKIHQNAFGDAMASMCSLDAGIFYDYKDALYNLEISKKGATISSSEYVSLAEKLGADKAAFEACISSKKYEDYVKKSMELGESLKITQTPTYILDGKPLQSNGFRSIEELRVFVDAYIKKNDTSSASSHNTPSEKPTDEDVSKTESQEN